MSEKKSTAKTEPKETVGTIKILHRNAIIRSALFKHEMTMPDTEANREEIQTKCAKMHLKVEFQEYPDKNETVAWLG